MEGRKSIRLYGEAYDQKVEQIDALKKQLKQVEDFLTNHLEEVTNGIGGVVGYKLNLVAAETEELFKLMQQ